MTVYVSTLRLKGSHLESKNPLPFFRDKNHNKPLIDGGLLPAEREGFGYETGFRVLPYTMQDNYKRAHEIIRLKTVVLENDFLRATFLPEYGGRLYSLFDKKKNRELLYVNPVFQPANLAIRNAWFSGGVEWNLGQFGHTFFTCSPMFFARCHDEKGNEFLRMYEYERCKGFFLQIDFHLPKGEEALYAHVSIKNSHKVSMPMYWWTNIAVEENRDVRVFSGNHEVIYIKPESMDNQQTVHSFGHGKMPYLETLNGLDASYPNNLPYSSEYFFQNPRNINNTWEVAVYNDGTAFWERSTELLRYRKMFCWGSSIGGHHWQEFLTEEGTSRYLEIQAGISPTQVHGCDIGPEERWSFTQVFGGADIDINKANGEWINSRDYIHNVVDSKLNAEKLVNRDMEFEELINIVPDEILNYGSGWGALEAKRDSSVIPQGMIFEENTLTEAQKPWLDLLENGKLTELSQGEIPVSWMIDARWVIILEESLKNEDNISAASLLHYGIMLYENGRWEEGIETLKKSMELCPTAICAFAIAQTMVHKGSLDEACDFMDKTIELKGISQSKSFAEEAIKIYNMAGQYQRAWELYLSLPEDLKEGDRMILEISITAFKLCKWDFLENAFSRSYALIREGESNIMELWYRKKAVDEARRRGISNYEDILDEIMDNYDPPYNIDFRMGIPCKKK